MPLNFSIVEQFFTSYREVMRDKTLLRHERFRILSELSDTLQSSLNDYTSFENELSSLIMNRIETATVFEELYECHRRAVGGVENFFIEEDSIVDVHDLFRIIRDSITVRVLTLAEREMIDEGFGPIPSGYVWVGLGSEGRDEQTLRTDQDNMIIYDNYSGDFATETLRKSYEDKTASMAGKDLSPGKNPGTILDHYFELFATKATERLNDVGFDKCKGGVMPSNAKWRGTIVEWKKRLEERMTFSRGEFEMLDILIFTDARPITGNSRLLEELMEHFFRKLSDNKSVMKEFIEAAVLMPTALTFFGNFKTEKSGDEEGRINVKLMGWAPLILSVRMAALVNGIYHTNTLKRIGALGDMNVIKREMENDLIEAYITFVKFRLLNQINRKDEKNANFSFVDPGMLGEEGMEKLRKAMRAVEAFQKYIQEILLFGQPV